MNRILLIDDDEELCELVGEYLSVEGFEISAVHDGKSGLEKALKGEFDLLILDVMLPKLNGFDVLRRLRENSNIPVLMLTARGEDMERIVGLEIGADDYLAKPFNPRELVARLRAILRRSPQAAEHRDAGITVDSDKIQIDDVELNVASRMAKRGNEVLQLTALEFDLLSALVRETGKVIAKDDLSQKVLGRKLSPFDRSLDMHISNLRKKLGSRSDGEERIKTIRSVGYIYTRAQL
jgi:two-component system, OmpR family, response regulator CpxR